MRENAGCTVERGIPLTLWTHKGDIQQWIAYLKGEAPRKPIFCRLYFNGTHMVAKSRQALNEELVKEIIRPKMQAKES